MREIRNRKDGRVGFRVRVQPSASVTKLLGWNAAGELRVSVAAPPREGAANRELVRAFSRFLSLPKGEVAIEAGERSRTKTVSVPGGMEKKLMELPEI